MWPTHVYCIYIIIVFISLPIVVRSIYQYQILQARGGSKAGLIEPSHVADTYRFLFFTNTTGERADWPVACCRHVLATGRTAPQCLDVWMYWTMTNLNPMTSSSWNATPPKNMENPDDGQRVNNAMLPESWKNLTVVPMFCTGKIWNTWRFCKFRVKPCF